MSHRYDTRADRLTAVDPFGAWGQIATSGRSEVPIRPRLRAVEALFPPGAEPLFDPGEPPWLEMVEGTEGDDEPKYRLNPDVAAAWNARWRGRKVRVFTPDSGITEGYCGGVGPGFLGPAVSIHTGPGTSLNADPRCVFQIVEIESFEGDGWLDDEEYDEPATTVSRYEYPTGDRAIDELARLKGLTPYPAPGDDY